MSFQPKRHVAPTHMHTLIPFTAPILPRHSKIGGFENDRAGSHDFFGKNFPRWEESIAIRARPAWGSLRGEKTRKANSARKTMEMLPCVTSRGRKGIN